MRGRVLIDDQSERRIAFARRKCLFFKVSSGDQRVFPRKRLGPCAFPPFDRFDHGVVVRLSDHDGLSHRL